MTDIPNTRVRQVMMTPDWARRLLGGNHSNRHLADSYVRFLAAEIKGGRWKLTTDAIAMAPNGRLLNGQHRLSAIVRADESVPVLLVENLDEGSFIALDVGRKRTTSDVTGLPPGLVADISLLLFMFHGHGSRFSPQETLDWQDTWSPAYVALNQAAGVSPRHGMNTSYLRVGCGIRWATERRPDMRRQILAQYRCLINADLDNATKAIRVFYRRVVDSRASKGASRDARMKSAAAAYVHFDPARSNIEPLIRNVSEVVDELRQWVRMMQDAYAGGPAKDGHPYVWPGRPQVERIVTGAAKMMKERAQSRRDT